MTRTGKAALAAAVLLSACTTPEGLTPEPKSVPSGEPVLSPIEMLKPDTAEAALTDSALFGVPYAGVWSAEPGGCRLIDVSADYRSFAVVTMKTLRLNETKCSIAPAAETPQVDALCSASGTTTPRTFTFTLGGDGALTIAEPASKASNRYVRCRLP